MGKNAPRDVLASRYASDAMVEIWGAEQKVILERRLWVAALKAQKKNEAVINAYERCINSVDLESIAARERKLRHDVKARIEEFNARASFVYGSDLEEIHEGFTSRDLTDNVEQMQILEALKLVRLRSVTVLHRLITRAEEFADVPICARTHNIPAQVTTLGKKIATSVEEMHHAFKQLEHLLKRYPIRGIKGPVGTQQDMIDLLGSEDAVWDFESALGIEMNWPSTLDCVGQVYPRSLDFQVVSTLTLLAAAPCNFALMVRLMAGHELMHEGFGKEQTGSSAMPHKMNSRTCERIMGLTKVLRGYLSMVSELSGDQWYEGDVSCSVVRRVALQSSFMALDGLYESVLTVLEEMQVYKGMLQKELYHYLPFLSTTAFLMAAVKKGVGRETAHKIIKEESLAAIEQIRDGAGGTGTNLLHRLAGRPELKLSKEVLTGLASPNPGRAHAQVRRVKQCLNYIFNNYPEALDYKPGAIL